MDIPFITSLYQKFAASSGVVTDTRTITPNSIFFALKGGNFNGNLFALEALQKGASFAVVDEKIEANLELENRLVFTENVLETLQQLALFHRQKLTCPVIAITGSNGKTTTKELMAVTLATKYKVAFTKGNLNNHIGVPLTLLSMPLDTQIAIVEMGANHLHEIEGYCEYAQPNFGLITNIGKAHLEGFGSEENVKIAKTELYRFIEKNGGTIFVNGEDSLLVNESQKLSVPKIFYGQKESYFAVAKLGENKTDFVSLEILESVIHSQLVGDYNFPNLMAAMCVGKYFEVPLESIKSAIENYQPSNNRSQKIKIETNTYILDAYNANPSSMCAALENFEKEKSTSKITILGEMMELGISAEKEHQTIFAICQKMDLENRIFVGDGFSFLEKNTSVMYFKNTQLLKDWLLTQNFQNKLILIKGSRKNGLEKLII